MSSTLTAADIFGVYVGFIDGAGGSVSPELSPAGATYALFTGDIADTISWATGGDNVSALSGLSHIKIDGTNYAVTIATNYDGGTDQTFVGFGPYTGFSPGTYSIELVGLAPPDSTGTLAATESGTDTAALAGQVTIVGAMAATESGADSFAATDAGAPSEISGTLAASETGADVAALSGGAAVAVTGTLAATESGADVAALSGPVLIGPSTGTATAARIAFISTDLRRAIAEDADVRTRHGDLARESDDPVPTFLDTVADAQEVADERQALLAPERRRFGTKVRGIDEVLALDVTTGVIPTVQYVDAERDCDRKMLVTGIVINLATQQAEFGVWG